MNAAIHLLNGTLMSPLNTNMLLGLAEGRMGLCIYFYILSRYEQNKDYEAAANKILDEIFKSIDKIRPINIKYGLTGIALGINYLINNNYIKGNVNFILKDVDSIIFKNLSYSKYYEKFDTLSLIHILYYLYIRLKNQRKNSENEYLFKEYIIQTMNNIYEKIDSTFLGEPFAYTIDYPLPQLLYVISKIYNLDFYNYRLIKIIEELSYNILSILPRLHANRLYLLWGMDALQKQINKEDWNTHIQLIKDQIDMNVILNKELTNNNISINDGYPGIYFLINSLKNYFTPEYIKDYTNIIFEKIESSPIWNHIKESQDIVVSESLYNGFCGAVLTMNFITKEK